MESEKQYITVDQFSTYAAQHIETTLMLFELVATLSTLVTSTLPLQVRGGMAPSIGDGLQKVRESIALLRGAIPQSDPEGGSGQIQ
jgi:hypothetical protein